MGPCELAGDVEAEAGACAVAAQPRVAPEHALALLRRDSRPVVAHGELDGLPGPAQRHLERAAGGRVPGGVREQVRQDLADADGIHRRGRLLVQLERDRPLGEQRPQLLDRLAHEVGEARRLGVKREPSRLERCASPNERTSWPRWSALRSSAAATRSAVSRSSSSSERESVAARPCTAAIGVFSSWTKTETSSSRPSPSRRSPVTPPMLRAGGL